MFIRNYSGVYEVSRVSALRSESEAAQTIPIQDFQSLKPAFFRDPLNGYVYSIGAPTGITATGTYDTAADAATGAEVVVAGNSSYLPAAVINGGSPKATDTLRAYIGLVDLATEQAGTLGGGTTVGVLCQKTTPGAINESFAVFDGIRSETYPSCNLAMADPLE
ncbi:MAG: hypothetical protein ACO34J_00900 [Prochlorothrix sp.]